MIIDIDSILKRNYQRVSTNRFIVDSPRFWRKEYHPRFKDIFEFVEFEDIVKLVNEEMSFKLKKGHVTMISIKLFDWFSGYRFVGIPAKNPEAPKQFLSDLYFMLLDTLPQLTFKEYPLIEDDFNLVIHNAETGKVDTSKVDTSEYNEQDTRDHTEADILTDGELKQTSVATTENIDDETDQNTKTNMDNYLSAQNQGVAPNNVSLKHKGVEGVTLNPSSGFTTNTANEVLGDSIKIKTNTSGQSQQAEDTLQQDNDIRTSQDLGNKLGMNQSQENTTSKNDVYTEGLNFDRGARLQAFYDLGRDRLYNEILGKLSLWILQADIATAERNYNDCPLFD